MKVEPIIVERVYNAPVSKVWEAITDAEKMREWYFNMKGFEPVVGCEFSFIAGAECNEYLHLCRVTEVIENKKLGYTWRYADHPGDSLVTFELFDEGGNTRLKLTHTGVESFGTENPDMRKENFIAGWTDIIGKILKEYVESEK